jgi:hypothetical protein
MIILLRRALLHGVSLVDRLFNVCWNQRMGMKGALERFGEEGGVLLQGATTPTLVWI